MVGINLAGCDEVLHLRYRYLRAVAIIGLKLRAVLR